MRALAALTARGEMATNDTFDGLISHLATVHPSRYFKVLDVYRKREHAQITLLHIPEELIVHLSTPELNEMEEEIVEAARANFEDSLLKPTVPALTEAEWLERTAFPLGMSEEGGLFYGGAPEGPN